MACRYESNLESIISNLLGGNVKCLVSACVIKELKTLAKDDRDFHPAVMLARKFMRHKCECPEDFSCTECLMKQTGAPPARPHMHSPLRLRLRASATRVSVCSTGNYAAMAV